LQNWQRGPDGHINRGYRAEGCGRLRGSERDRTVFKHLRITLPEFDQIAGSMIRIVLLGAIVALGLCIIPGLLATLSRTADVQAALTAVWSMMGRQAPGEIGWRPSAA
jgi:hypothetical protein